MASKISDMKIKKSEKLIDPWAKNYPNNQI